MLYTFDQSARGAATTRRWPVAILGVPFDPVTLDDALDGIEAMIATGRPHYVVTPNVDFLVQARRDPGLRRILMEAHLVLCDGQPLVWASRWLGNALPERVAGSDLVPRLLARVAARGRSVFLLGASPEANLRAAAGLRRRLPALRIAGRYSPPFAPLERMDDEAIVRRIRASRPDILLVSFGCPKQEKWMARNYERLRVPVCLGVGATIDFLAGQVRRAPRWMQRAGLEWTYRLAQEPRRLLGRYADDIRCFGAAILGQVWRTRPRPGPAPARLAIADDGRGWQCVRVRGRLDRAGLESVAAVWGRVEADPRDCAVDLGGVDFVDSTGAAALAELRNRLRGAGRRLVLLAPSPQVRRALAGMGWTGIFDVGWSPPEAGPAAMPRARDAA